MENQNYKLSVRLMTYMHGSFIKQAMEGIMMQKTNFKVEVVIGDDFSTDNTLDIIRLYKDTPQIHIKILKRDKGGDYWFKRQKFGRLYNFTNILDNCQGKYIALLDGDDYWTDPLKLQKQVDFLEGNPEIGASFTNATIHNHINQTTSEYNKPYKLKEGILDNSVIFSKGGGVFPTCTLMFKAELAPSFFIKELAGDEMLLLTIANNSKIAFQDFISATYNRRSDGVFSGIINDSKKLIEFRKKEIIGYKKLLLLINDTNKAYLKAKMKKIALYIIRSNKYSFSNLKYMRIVGVKTFVKIYLDDLK